MSDTLTTAPVDDPHNPSVNTAQTVQVVPGPATTLPHGEIALALIVAALALAGGAGFILRRRKPAPVDGEVLPLPPKAERVLVEVKPSEAQLQAGRERERLENEARQKAGELERRRADAAALARDLQGSGAAVSPDATSQLQDQQRILREAEEEKKKAEYRARKASEVEEKERRKVEAEARVQAEQEEARLRAQEEASRKAALEAAQRQKVEAVAGKTLAQGLDRTRQGFMARLGRLWGGDQKVDEKTLGELESVLFTADIGVKTAQSLLEVARERLHRSDADGAALRSAIRAEVERILSASVAAAGAAPGRPRVVMVVGVNGSGKTTTIGKLAAKEKSRGQKVVLAAGDTFRAAAAEQLAVWGQRSDVPVIRGNEGSDPGAVVFDAVKRAQADAADLVICDTAGRLHTQTHLMEELKKVKRVLEKARAGAPDEVLLVLDSTNGQNAIAQARQFHEALGVTGIALTKLDGTAKGGVIIGICDELKIPVRFVGVGEGIEDLRAFDPAEFVEALFA